MNINESKNFLINVATGMYGQTKLTRQQVDTFFNKAEEHQLTELALYARDWTRRQNPIYENEIFDLENYVLGVCFS